MLLRKRAKAPQLTAFLLLNLRSHLEQQVLSNFMSHPLADENPSRCLPMTKKPFQSEWLSLASRYMPQTWPHEMNLNNLTKRNDAEGT